MDLKLPLVVFDGDCGFCRRLVARWQEEIGDRAEWIPFQALGDRLPEVPRERFAEAVHLAEPDPSQPNGRRVTSGAEAVFRILALAPERKGRWRRLYEDLPGFAPLSEWGYRRVARNRKLASSVYKLFAGGP